MSHMTAITPETPDSAHPLAATIGRVNAVGGGWLDVRVGAVCGDGWFAATEVIDGKQTMIETALARLGDSLQSSDSRAISTFFFKTYCNQIVGVGVGSLLTQHRAPALDARSILLHAGASGPVDGIALLGSTIAVLPDDPAAGHPDSLVLPDLPALRDYLLTQMLDNHLSHMIDAMRSVLPLGKRMMWSTVADTVAGVAILLIKHLGQRERCEAEVRALVGKPPLAGRSGVVRVEDDGVGDYFLKRAACCFAYRLPAYGHCTTCPLLTADEREQRLRTHLREHAP